MKSSNLRAVTNNHRRMFRKREKLSCQSENVIIRTVNGISYGFIFVIIYTSKVILIKKSLDTPEKRRKKRITVVKALSA